MARETSNRPRKYEPRTPRAQEQYEARRPDLRPASGGAQIEPRLGPYEFRYSVELGYSSQDRVV